MGDLTDHFSRHEFKCKCPDPLCTFSTVDAELLALLERIRLHFGKRVDITSACRCPAYNLRIGGTKKSKHLEGCAADIVVADTTPEEVAAFVETVMPDRGGIGIYPQQGFTHLDPRQTKARWTST